MTKCSRSAKYCAPLTITLLFFAFISSPNLASSNYYLKSEHSISIEKEIEQYLDLFDSLVLPENNYTRGLSWNYSEYILGLGYIYEYFNDQDVLARMVRGSDYLISRRNDYYDKLILYVDDQMLPVWPAFEDRWKLNNKAVPFTNHLMTANIMQPIAMTALFLSQSGNRAHQEKARYYIRQLEQTLDKFSFSELWFDKQKNLFIHANTSKLSEIKEVPSYQVGEPVSFNRILMMSSVLYLILKTKEILNLQKNTEKYKTTVSHSINYFKRNVQNIECNKNKICATWNFGGSNASNKIRTEDIFHGGLVALSLLIIYDNGLDKYNISDNLLHKIGNTYLFKLRKISRDKYQFFEYLDGTGENITEQRQVSNLLWCGLSTINKSIWTDSCSKQLNSKGVSIRDGMFLAMGISIKHQLIRKTYNENKK